MSILGGRVCWELGRVDSGGGWRWWRGGVLSSFGFEGECGAGVEKVGGNLW